MSTPPPRPPQVGVCGGEEPRPAEVQVAEQLGSGLAQRGVRGVCGGLGGVMEAVARGARQAGGEALAILPGTDPREASAWCTHVVAAGTGHARNLAVAASGDVVVAVGGAWGTLSEIALARRLGRPVVVLASWDVVPPGGGDPQLHRAPGVDEALGLCEQLLARQR